MSVNTEVANVLYEIAELYTVKGEVFRSRAYRAAAQRIESLTDDIRDIYVSGRLEEIPGIGKGIATVLEEWLKTGSSSLLDELRKLLPYGTLELMALEGVGPKTAMKLYKELGVSSINELEKAIGSGKIRRLKGFGPKSEENLLRVLKEHGSREDRSLLGQVLPIIREIEEFMETAGEPLKVDIAGSARRMRETVGDLDFLVACDSGEKAVEHFTSMPNISRIVTKGTTRSTVIMRGGLQVDLRVVPPKSYGAALQYFTGSKRHSIKLRGLASNSGYKLNEYGLFERETDTWLAGETEASIYNALGLTYIEPELREDRGEIEASKDGSLPELVRYGDVKGDLHVHSNWSDGTGSLEEIAEEAVKRGFQYVAICDHSKSLGIAHGLNEERLKKQIAEVEKLNRNFDSFRLLSGIEVDIMADGTLDLPNSILRDLDFVVASVHRGFKANAEKMTERVVSAIHNDYVSCIGHPTGRLIQKRKPYQLNLEEVFKAAAQQRVMMEINAFPNRLDLNDVNSRAAKEHNVPVSIGTNAHTPTQLKYLELGVSVARRGWLESDDVANTLDPDDVVKKHKK